MDHLPPVSNPNFPPVEIEYLKSRGEPSVLEYDNQGFTDFPARAGWDKTHLLQGNFLPDFQQNTRPVAEFVQQWLFFGLLSAAMNHHYDMETILQDFTTTSPSSGKKVVSTRNLERYLIEWRNALTPAELETGSDTIWKLDALLGEAQQHVAVYMCRAEQKRAEHPMEHHQDISLSITALAVTLTRAKKQIWPRSRSFTWQHSELVLSRMTEAGWCPSDISMLEKLVTPNGMYYASLLRPRMIQYNHLQEGCNKDFCQVMNISEQTKLEYYPVHTEDCDGHCVFKHVPEDQLVETLEQENSIPVVQLFERPQGDFELSMSSMALEKNSGYVAISHVWADRLGNTRDNAMRTCQLRRIQALITEASKGLAKYFWIDTLCVPQSNLRQRLQSYRIRAIQNMDRIYRSSQAVLVLDNELQSTRSDAPFEEQLVRFACCSWIRRLWTLQEAVNGPRILLQFSDRAVDMMADVFHRIPDYPGSTALTQTVLTEFTDFLWRIVLVKEPSGYPRITALWNACQYRSTSDMQDEAFCLAVILRLDPRQILAVPEGEKWRTFLLQQRIFPKDLLFCSGPRLAESGFRWAPRQFIRRPATVTASSLLSMGTAEASHDGLAVTSLGFVFKPPRAPFHPDYGCFRIMCHETKKWYLVVHRTVQGDGHIPWKELVQGMVRCKKLGIIVNQDLNTMAVAYGVLVDLSHGLIGDGDAEILSAGFLATVNVMLEDPGRWASLEQRRKDEEDFENVVLTNSLVVTGAPVSQDQRWCVG